MSWLVFLAVALSVAPAAGPDKSACPLPRLDFRASTLGTTAQAQFTDRFRAAFDRACREGLFAERPLVDPRARQRSLLHVMNAPEANATSIYFELSAAPPAMLLESPFGPTPEIPSADDLHEAIYCAVRGATPEEEIEDGRCLVD